VELEAMTLDELLTHGRVQSGNLTFYKLVFQALERLAFQNSVTDDVYQRALVDLISGFMAVVKPEFLPQASAAKALLLKKVDF
jgi:hypothetical protein